MTLGQLLNTLEAADSDAPVRFSNGVTPTRFASWRGRYNDLTLYHGGSWNRSPDDDPGYTEDPECTVRDLLQLAREADGGTFQGYKGGDYTMRLDTPIWADDYGCCDYMAIVGSRVEDGALVLVTQYIGEYV